jgi:hypothetical protein
MKTIHDHESFARMIAAQAHLRARLIAHRRAFPHPFRLLDYRPPWPVDDADDADGEVLWLEAESECPHAAEDDSGTERSNDLRGANGAEESAAALARRRCA